MSDGNKGFTAEDTQTVDNVLRDSAASPLSRRKVLQVAAATAAGASLFRGSPSFAQGSPQQIGTAAVTAEALAVTYLTNVIQAAGGKVKSSTARVLKAANAAEQAHYDFLNGAGFNPLTKRFWIPNVAFEIANVPAVIEYFESVFVNAYLIGTVAFASAGKSELARYTVEIGGVEAEHLALARSLQNELPNNLAFTSYTVDSISDIVAAIKATGVGLGQKGATPGKFYTYSAPPAGAVVDIKNTDPQ